MKCNKVATHFALLVDLGFFWGTSCPTMACYLNNLSPPLLGKDVELRDSDRSLETLNSVIPYMHQKTSDPTEMCVFCWQFDKTSMSEYKCISHREGHKNLRFYKFCWRAIPFKSHTLKRMQCCRLNKINVVFLLTWPTLILAYLGFFFEFSNIILNINNLWNSHNS